MRNIVQKINRDEAPNNGASSLFFMSSSRRHRLEVTSQLHLKAKSAPSVSAWRLKLEPCAFLITEPYYGLGIALLYSYKIVAAFVAPFEFLLPQAYTSHS